MSTKADKGDRKREIEQSPMKKKFRDSAISSEDLDNAIANRIELAFKEVKSSHLYLYSAFNNTDCVKALNSIKLEDRVSVMYNNKIKHSIFS